MKMEINIKIISDKGKEIVKPVIVDAQIPDFDEYIDSNNFREVFNRCEQSVLKIRNKSVEVAIEKYLKELSKKKANTRASHNENLEILEDDKKYEIEAELGRLEITTCRVIRGSRTVFNSNTDLFPKKAQKGKYNTACFDALSLKLASNITSFRACADILNHIRWQDNDNNIKYRTLRDNVAIKGNKIINYLDSKKDTILKSHKFSNDTGNPLNIDSVDKSIVDPVFPIIEEEKINNIIDEYNDGKSKKRQIDETQIKEIFVEDEYCVNVSIDDVGTVEQKESGRTKYPEPKEGRHYVKNTVIHIQQGFKKYILDGLGIKKMLLIMLAFLLENNELTNKHLIFFTDGASDIRKPIKEIFQWRSYQILLDWYHLREKCKQRLSMAMKGKDLRNEVLKDILGILWAGNVEGAVDYLRNIDSKKVKNNAEIEKLISYFDKNWSYIPCYALRQKLGLRISSNRGEKANDLVVAKRQKHNGMSWSKYGSSGLANISSMFLNNENENWIVHRKLDFKLNSGTLDKVA